MWLTATGIFLGTQIIFLQPIQTNKNFYQLTHKTSIQQDDLRYFAPDSYLKDKQDSVYTLASGENKFVGRLAINTLSRPSLTLDRHDRNSSNFNNYSFQEQPVSFQPGTASWKTNTQVGSLTLDGNFDAQARFTKGRAFWQSSTKLGSVDLAVNVDDKLKPLKSIAAWHTDSVLGSFTVKSNFDRETTFTGGNAAWNAKTIVGEITLKGNFDRETTFTGGNAAWNAKTSLVSLGLNGNFDRHTVFTGGDIRVSTKTFIGSFAANVKVDGETNFSGADASWNSNFLFGSNIGVSGKFNENNSFNGGSIKLGTKTSSGTLGVEADVDSEMKFTDFSVKMNFSL
ncbi:MAG: hypothetical protein QNJ72_25050 [Pleurocapsa sp. MO_226.B13]|nr:hypothetical protein [Pleurocapsa sp. MO_226.B13]